MKSHTQNQQVQHAEILSLQIIANHPSIRNRSRLLLCSLLPIFTLSAVATGQLTEAVQTPTSNPAHTGNSTENTCLAAETHLQNEIICEDTETPANIDDLIDHQIDKLVEARIAMHLSKSGKLHLDEQLNQQIEKVKDARIAMHKAMKEPEVIDLAKSSGNRSDEVITPKDKIIATGEMRVDDMKFQISGLKSQLEGLQGLESSDMIRKAAMLGIEDQTIQRYYPMFNDLLLEEQQALENGLGENHPTVRAIQAQLASFQGILMEAVKDVQGALEIKVEQLEARLAEAIDKKADEKEDYISNALNKETYNNLRATYLVEKDILKALTIEAYSDSLNKETYNNLRATYRKEKDILKALVLQHLSKND